MTRRDTQAFRSDPREREEDLREAPSEIKRWQHGSRCARKRQSPGSVWRGHGGCTNAGWDIGCECRRIGYLWWSLARSVRSVFMGSRLRRIGWIWMQSSGVAWHHRRKDRADGSDRLVLKDVFVWIFSSNVLEGSFWKWRSSTFERTSTEFSIENFAALSEEFKPKYWRSGDEVDEETELIVGCKPNLGGRLRGKFRNVAHEFRALFTWRRCLRFIGWPSDWSKWIDVGECSSWTSRLVRTDMQYSVVDVWLCMCRQERIQSCMDRMRDSEDWRARQDVRHLLNTVQLRNRLSIPSQFQRRAWRSVTYHVSWERCIWHRTIFRSRNLWKHFRDWWGYWRRDTKSCWKDVEDSWSVPDDGRLFRQASCVQYGLRVCRHRSSERVLTGGASWVLQRQQHPVWNSTVLWKEWYGDWIVELVRLGCDSKDGHVLRHYV